MTDNAIRPLTGAEIDSVNGGIIPIIIVGIKIAGKAKVGKTVLTAAGTTGAVIGGAAAVGALNNDE